MENKKRVLVTGGAGYIGSVLVRQLLQKNYQVGVIDILKFGGESLLEVYNHPNFVLFKEDIRNIDKIKDIVEKYDVIVHLAAIVGDPACKAEPDLTKSINLEGSKSLYELANQSKIKQFIFASTCSNYGKMEDPNSYVTEESKLLPISLYAETKVEFENFLLSQNKDNICKPTCLRFSTVYGVGPRIRFDLTVNEFTKELALDRELTVFGEQFWRPYCHVDDLAKAIILTIESDLEKVSFDVFNVGDTKENYTKKMIIENILTQLPNSQIKYIQKNEDPRDYRVNFDKIKNKLGFEITKTVPDGITEIIKLIKYELLNNLDDDKYKNC